MNINGKKLAPGAFVTWLAAMMALAVACKKDPIPDPAPTPEPTPDTITPIDTITPVNPDDTIVPIPPNPGDTVNPSDTITPVVFDTVELPIKPNNITWTDIVYPTQDTIRKLLAMDKIIILRWYIPPNVTNGWTPESFHPPRDTLKKRFAMSDKIFGSGKIYVNKNYGGASIPCEDSLTISKLGMTKCDSAIFAGWGFEPYVKYSKSQRDVHAEFLDTVGMKRAILDRSR